MAPSTNFEFLSFTQTIRRSVSPAIDPKNAMNSAAGKAKGIGKGIAQAFVQAQAHAVVILGRRAAVLASAKKGHLEALSTSAQILTFQADIVDAVALNAAFASAFEQVGVHETEMFAKSAMPLTFDDMSLLSSFAVWLASERADWTKSKFLWAHWDVEELEQLKGEILEKGQLQMVLNGFPRVEKPTVVL